MLSVVQHTAIKFRGFTEAELHQIWDQQILILENKRLAKQTDSSGLRQSEVLSSVLFCERRTPSSQRLTTTQATLLFRVGVIRHESRY